MKKLNRFTLYLLFVSIAMSACSSSGKEEIRISPKHTKPGMVHKITEQIPQPTQANTQASGEIQAETPPLTLESTSEEIREKMISSFMNWQTMIVEGDWENSSLNPDDDSVAYTTKYKIHSWIDQENLRFRSEEQQVDSEEQPKLAISDGTSKVIREAARVIEGYSGRPSSTYLYRVNAGNAEEETLRLLRSGQSLFSPMGEVYFGRINSELFSSAYAIQYSGEYEVLGLENIAGRETLKVFYDDAQGWGGSNIKHTLWIDTDTGVVLKSSTDGTPDHFTEGMEITAIAYNVPVDEKKFNIEDAMPDLSLTEMESDTVDGNTIYADNLRVGEDRILLDVCYELPSNSDWMLYEISTDDKKQINPSGYLIYMEPAGTLQDKGLRCDELTFAYTLEGETFHFEIGQLMAPVREGQACNASDQVSQDLKKAGTPIEFTCAEDHGMILAEILSKPDTMTEEEAKMKVHELFVPFRNESIPGPWVFDLKQQDERLSAIESAAPGLNLASMQSETVNGYAIYAGNLTIEGDQVSLDVCYELPSNSQWIVHDILVEGKKQSNIFGHGLYMEPAGTFQEKGFRCDTLTFIHAFEDDVLNFEVGQLYSAAREGDPCDVSDWVSQDLIDAGTPVAFSCVAQSGVAKTEILTWSDRLTKEEARIRVEELFEQYRVEIQPGPWVFELQMDIN